jgi:hypothetical protein
VALRGVADEERLGAAFHIGEIFRARKSNPVGYFGAWIVAFGFFHILYFPYFLAYLTVILCCPGYVLFLVGTLAAGCVFFAMAGLAYREGKAVSRTG